MLAPHRKYKSALSMLVVDIDNALQKVYPTKHLWKVSENDSARLTRILVWSERYGVSVEYILEVILGYYYSHLPKLRSIAAFKSRSLGIRISVLVADGSHSILCESLERDFPDGNNLAAFKEEEKERISDAIDPDSLPTKSRGPLQYKSISAYVRAYSRKMETQRSGSDRTAREMRKIAWRGNPWL